MSGCQSNIVTFDYDAWAAAFPEFATTVATQAQAQWLFNDACLYCDNTPCSAVPVYRGPPGQGIPVRQQVLFNLTAHMAQLRVGSVKASGAAPASPLVGRISAATEGSVTVTADMKTPGSADWFMQTPYGAAAWQALAPYRVGFYAAPPQVPLPAQSFPGLVGGGWWP